MTQINANVDNVAADPVDNTENAPTNTSRTESFDVDGTIFPIHVDSDGNAADQGSAERAIYVDMVLAKWQQEFSATLKRFEKNADPVNNQIAAYMSAAFDIEPVNLRNLTSAETKPWQAERDALKRIGLGTKAFTVSLPAIGASLSPNAYFGGKRSVDANLMAVLSNSGAITAYTR
jgi:hypothetical protein